MEYIIHLYYIVHQDIFVNLTDSIGHTVQEKPLVLSNESSEANIVAGLDADHREKAEAMADFCDLLVTSLNGTAGCWYT